MLSEKISYFIIAFAIYLLGKSLLFFAVTPPIYLTLDAAIAVSLLCGNVPRVLYLPRRYLPLLRNLENAGFAVAILALLAMLTFR